MQREIENKVLHTRSHVMCCNFAIEKLISHIFYNFTPPS